MSRSTAIAASGGGRLPVVFGVLLDDLQEDWPGRNQLMLRMSAERPVVLLEARRKAGAPIPRVEQLEKSLFAIRGAFASSTSRWLRQAGKTTARADAGLFERALRRAGLAPYCFWLETPEPRLVRHIRPALLVYDCMDPCLEPALTQDHEARERECVQRANLIFATAASLERRMRAFGGDPIRLPNGSLEDDLKSDLSYDSARRDLGVEGKIASYLGTIDSRVDLTLLKATARRLPDWQFVLAGRVNRDRERDADALGAESNVRVYGSVDRVTGRRVIAAADVCMIPFVEGQVGDAINPVKMFSYLAFGKPIVSTDIEECRNSPFVCTASGAEAFGRALRAAEATDPRGSERRRFAEANTWGVRARFASDTLDRAAGAALGSQ